MSNTTTDLITPEEVARFLRISEVTLRRWRSAGYGPKPYYLTGRTVRYKTHEVEQWVIENGVGNENHEIETDQPR